MTNLEGLRIYPHHVQQCGYCLVPGARDWFKHHNLDWRSFVYNGIDASQLAGIQDSLCTAVIEQALKESANG